MANGEWRVASGEWRMASGEWRMANGEWRVSEFSKNTTSKELLTKSVKSIVRKYVLHWPFATRHSPFAVRHLNDLNHPADNEHGFLASLLVRDVMPLR
jgi:hypothetical protein